jgi:glycosyltransferase involved in cell wall biosynthesis
MNEYVLRNPSVRSLAFRYNMGPSGGPGGVNALLQIYNGAYKIIPSLTCHFQPRIACDPEARLTPAMRQRLELQRFLDQAVAPDANTLYIAHDPCTALHLNQRRRPYALVYHQQGSFVSEARSFGINLAPATEENSVRMERGAFGGARKIAFPSRGARDEYMRTSLLKPDEIGRIATESVILYNTCYLDRETVRPPEADAIERLAGPRRKIILTVASLTGHKGADQIPAFLARIENFTRDFLWVLVGSGPLQPTILDALDRSGIREHCLHIERRMPQTELATLMDMAAYYLMMHRLSIFDMATLEAMSRKCVPILTPVGGNLEFDKERNILYTNRIGPRLHANDSFLEIMGRLNQKVQNEYFGPIAFLQGYRRIVDESCAENAPETPP